MTLRTALAAGLLALPALIPAYADDGLWLFNQFPKDQLKQKYNVDIGDDFLENTRLATVRVGSASGAFVSPHGLIVTSRRAAAQCAPKTAETFLAPAQTDEKACPGLDAAVLIAIEDVTRQVKEGEAPKAKPAELIQKRAGIIARIEKDCAAKTGNVCTVVKLFSGERYDLYHYKRYADLRLIFAPETAIANFGGNPVELTYPRYSLDAAFLRAYENGKPAETPHFFKWSMAGINEGDLVFAAGAPLSTGRLATLEQIEFYRDSSIQIAVQRLQNRVSALITAAPKSAGLLALGADYKLTAGKLIGLKDEWLMARKANFQKKLRNAVEHDPKLGLEGGKVWDEVATAYKNWTPFERQYQLLEKPAAQGSVLFAIARGIVRNDAAAINTEAPIEDDVEIAMLTRYLDELRNVRQGDSEINLKTVMGAKNSKQAAEEMVKTTKLKDLAARKSAPADDPIVRLAKLVEAPAKNIAKRHAEAIESLEASAAERIAQYRYKIFGAADYPDATGALRLTYGFVHPYLDRTEEPVPFATTFGGLFHFAAKYDPYMVPAPWNEAKAALGQVTPMDFVSTADITAGASGAPAINMHGELVGITFDGNIESIAITYLYDDEKARAVHVSAQGLAEALQKVYKAAPLLRELGITPVAAASIAK